MTDACSDVTMRLLACVLLQAGLRRLRGQDDALNVCVAGSVSAGFLGATCECSHRRDCVTAHTAYVWHDSKLTAK